MSFGILCVSVVGWCFVLYFLDSCVASWGCGGGSFRNGCAVIVLVDYGYVGEDVDREIDVVSAVTAFFADVKLPEGRKLLAVYPVFLFYSGIAWMVLVGFQEHK
jgi:hypothetical protein